MILAKHILKNCPKKCLEQGIVKSHHELIAIPTKGHQRHDDPELMVANEARVMTDDFIMV